MGVQKQDELLLDEFSFFRVGEQWIAGPALGGARLLLLLLLLLLATGRWYDGCTSWTSTGVHLLAHGLLLLLATLGGRCWSDLGGRFAGRWLHRRWRWRLRLGRNSALVNNVHATKSGTTGEHVSRSKRISHPSAGHVHVRHPVWHRGR